MSAANYNRIVKEWEGMLGWHEAKIADPKAVMSDWLRENKHCDSKDKTGGGYKAYLRYIGVNGKCLAVAEEERIAWIQGKLEEFQKKQAIQARTGVKTVRVKPGTAHDAKAEVLEPSEGRAKNIQGVSTDAFLALAEAYLTLKQSFADEVKRQAALPTAKSPAMAARIDGLGTIIAEAGDKAEPALERAKAILTAKANIAKRAEERAAAAKAEAAKAGIHEELDDASEASSVAEPEAGAESDADSD